MRRFAVAMLLVLFLSESSGVALADTSSWRDPSLTLATLFGPMRAAFNDSIAYAVLTRTTDRYNATHASAPEIVRPISSIAADPSGHEMRALRPIVRKGVRRMSILPTRVELDPRRPHRDPLAMHPSHVASAEGRTLDSATGPRLLTAAAPVQGANSARRVLPRSGRRVNPLNLSNAGAGAEPWWTYWGRAIPGIGRAAVNVGTGDLLVSATDVDVKERGVDLELKRTYNSQSLHDVYGDDGGQPAIFGNLWTNALDANIVYSASQNTITVYDPTGASCTYTADGFGNWIPCAGVHATLAPTNPSDCNYAWTQPNGVIYVFETDNALGACSIQHDVVGHLVQLLGRNANNNITLNYSYYQGRAGSENVTEIVATHSDGHTVVMQFGVLPNSAINELATVTLPDGTTTLQYSYDGIGDLTRVDKPGNNSASSFPPPPQGQPTPPPGDVAETYSYGSSFEMTGACGPRCTAALWSSQPDGAGLAFQTNGSNRLTKLQVQGILNFIPSDGTNVALQPGTTGSKTWYTASFVYGSGNACSNASSGATTMCDSDGHGSIWTIDSSFRVTQAQEATNDTGTTNLVTTEVWDANNNLKTYQNPFEYTKGSNTQLSYDGNGNLTEVQLPVTQTSQGSLRPTTTYSYDTYNNLLAICDPNYNATHSGACPTSPNSGSQVFLYDTSNPDPAEPFGKPTNAYNATGYETDYHYSYNTNKEPGDFGLPTQVIADKAINEADGTQITPQQNYAYDGFGNVTSFDRGAGQSAFTLSYDGLNRVITGTDADGVTSRACYFIDGSVQARQSALQYQFDNNKVCGSNSATYLYDTDGDVTDETRHFGGQSADVAKWYDGLDRLVEARYPPDQQNDGNLALRIRYLFDISQDGSNLQVGNGPQFRGHGNMYKTQRYYLNVNSNKAWSDVNGNAFDAADRPAHRYQYTPTYASSGSTPGANPGPLEIWDTNFDENNQSGLLTSVNDPSGAQQATYTYNAIGKMTTKSFSDSTPTDSYTYDPDGNLSTANNSVASDTYVYNVDGTLQSDAEGTLSDPATLTYNYYQNGWRKSVAVSDSAASYSSSDTYSYRQDGLRETLAMDSQQNPFSWTYTAAGREKSQSDPATGSGPFSNGITIGAKTESYDGTTGVLKSMTMPDGLQYKGPISYDQEGEPTGFNITFPGEGSGSDSYITSMSYSYDSRGALYESVANGSGKVFNYGPVTLTESKFSFGHAQCERALGGCGGCITNCSGVSPVAVDENTGAAYAAQGGIYGQGSGDQCRWGQFPSYDADGRDATLIETFTSFASCNAPPPTVVKSRTYDAEDHITNDCDGAYQQGACPWTNTSFQWGPRGELRFINGGPGSKYTIHWDGDNIALSTDAQNNPSRYVEKLAAVGGGQLVIYDRDFSRTTVVESHTKTGDSGVTVAPNYSVPTGKWTFANLQGTYASGGSSPGSPPSLGIARIDGYSYYLLNFQGARVYDGNLGNWITPDLYKGNPNNPSSQWEYAWNSNNPLTNADPTGYSPDLGFPLAMSPFTMDNGQIVARDEGGETITQLPYNQESAQNGFDYADPVGGAIGSNVATLAFSESGPEVAFPLAEGTKWVAGFAAGEVAATWCGYVAQCSAPPPWWDTAWQVAGVGADLYDFSKELLTIARVSSKPCSASFSCAVGTGQLMQSAFDEESFGHINQAVGGEDPIAWAYGNADPYIR